MNERPTPRTDSAIMEIPSKFDSICVVRVELALDLERELGEALDDLQVLRSNKMSDPLLETTFKNIIRERDEAREAFVIATDQMVQAQSVLRETRRDLAEAQIECLERARLLSMSSEREAKLIYERDEARKIASELAIQAERLRKGRDEAREEIRGWKRLHDAAERGVDLTIAEGTISDLLKQRDEARELAQELLDALSKLVALNAEMTSDDCTYERAYYCYYKGHYDKWKLATEALAKAKEGAK